MLGGCDSRQLDNRNGAGMTRTLIYFIAAIAIAAPAEAGPNKKSETSGAQSFNGQWATAGKVVAVNSVGLDSATINSIMKQTISHDACLPFKYSSDDLKSVLADSLGECSYSRFSMHKGRVSALMQCTGALGKMSVDFRGTYSGSDFSGTNVSVFKTTSGDVSVTSTLVGNRVGKC